MALVLVVDDEYAIAKLLEDVLTDEGHRVVIAGNGRQALEAAARERPAIVMTDFMMPIMDGASLVRAMATDEVLRSIPVILISSMPEETVAERCSGYRSFLRKPFKIADVIETVTAQLSSKRADPDQPTADVPDVNR